MKSFNKLVFAISVSLAPALLAQGAPPPVATPKPPNEVAWDQAMNDGHCRYLLENNSKATSDFVSGDFDDWFITHGTIAIEAVRQSIRLEYEYGIDSTTFSVELDFWNGSLSADYSGDPNTPAVVPTGVILSRLSKKNRDQVITMATRLLDKDIKMIQDGYHVWFHWNSDDEWNALKCAEKLFTNFRAYYTAFSTN